ncbi:MAG: M3 family metallopeptidase [Rudaea sp.]
MSLTNPLLDPSALPAFGKIRPQHVLPAINTVLAEYDAGIAAMVADPAPRDFTNTMLAQELLDTRLEQVWSPISHLHAVADTPALREAHAAAEQRLSEHAAQLGQNSDLYAAVKAVSDPAGFCELPRAARTLVEHALRDFELSGVGLVEPARTRFREIVNELTRLGTLFENAVLDATEAWTESVDESALNGLPPAERALLHQAARDAGTEGWLVTLKQPSVQAILTYADARDLRERVYHAYHTRASDQGPQAGRFDNSARIEQIMGLRHEAAQLLGFANAAEVSLATKMAATPERVLAFLHDLLDRAKPVGEHELTQLREFAHAELGLAELQPWDIAYASEKLRLRQFALSEEELKPYFPLPRVIDGLFAITQRVFGVSLAPRDVAVWHPDVRYYELRDVAGETFAGVYVDVYARAGKRGGAWMEVCRSRLRCAGKLQLPVAYLTCNFSPPVDDQPALLTHDDVITLFHEFGHGLHHLLTEVDFPGVSGISGVEWDAVELPSQFMENFAWQREALNLFARHWQTGEILPDALFTRMLAARHFQAGLFLLRQLEYALFDFRLHLEFEPARGARTQELIDAVRRDVAVIVPPHWQRMANTFAHIFADGYAAGYYSYLWAELLSADAFSRFEESGIFDAATGAAYRHSILAAGGSRPALESFVEFRGREPKADALLRSYGLAA